MPLFQLDPRSIAERMRSTGAGDAMPPSLTKSVFRGIIGFTLVSFAGFTPWPIIGRWFPAVSEVGLYVACTAVFIGLSGVCLHRLILGPGSLLRFYKVFSLAFMVYAAAWVFFWMSLRGDAGIFAGLLVGTAGMGLILAFAFDALRRVLLVVAALFALQALGYYAGEWVYGKLGNDYHVAAMLLWGVCYGMGFGAGLGVAFHVCQNEARVALVATRLGN
jgi:hypothetical protein